MTINEVRLDMMSQGFTILERMINGSVYIEITKLDTDGLRFINTIVLNRDIMYEAHNPQYIDVIKDLHKLVNEAITNRYAQNPNNCEHSEVMVGSTKSCTKCMSKFGERMNIDFNWN